MRPYNNQLSIPFWLKVLLFYPYSSLCVSYAGLLAILKHGGIGSSFPLEHSSLKYLFGSLPHCLQISSQIFQWSLLWLGTAIYLLPDFTYPILFLVSFNLQTYYIIFVCLSFLLTHKNGRCTQDRYLHFAHGPLEQCLKNRAHSKWSINKLQYEDSGGKTVLVAER